MEDSKETTTNISVPSEQDAKITTATTTEKPVEPSVPVTSTTETTTAETTAETSTGTTTETPAETITEKEEAKKDTPEPVPEKTTVSKEGESGNNVPATSSTTPPATQHLPRGSRRNIGVSSIASRVHSRSSTEGKLPSRFSDYEVGSQSPRVSRQRSNDSLKKGSATKEKEAKKETGDTVQPVAPPPPPPSSSSHPASVESKEVDPADALEMMLMSSGALPREPPSKKSHEETTATTETTVSTPSTTSSTTKRNRSSSASITTTTTITGSSPTSGKKSKSKKKSLVEGREARVVKPKFSLEMEMSLSDELQKCFTLLKGMFSQADYSPFYYAVDPIRLNIPDYFDVIKHPMDMTKIKEKLLSGRYADAKQFTQDIHLMFENARTYNPVGNPIHALAERLESSFEEQMAKIHSRRVSSAPASSSSSSSSSAATTTATATSTSSSSQLTSASSKSSSRSKHMRVSHSKSSSSMMSDSSSSSSDSSSSSSGDSDDERGKRKKDKHHKHHHHHHHHGKKGGKKRPHSSSAANDLIAYEESRRRREEMEKLYNEIRLLKSQLKEQKHNKVKEARAERAAAAAARRTSKYTAKRPPLSFDTTPDPDRPVTEEDKRRISGNINRLPPERMLPLVSFVQDQIPSLCLVVPGCAPLVPSEIEVDLDTLDNRTLRTVDHKVRQALALAGQARRRAERRLLEMQMQKEQQLRHHASLPIEQKQRVIQAKSSFQNAVLTSQQTAMNYVNSLQRNMVSPVGTPTFSQQDMSLPGTPGSGQSRARSTEEDDDDEMEDDDVDDNDITANLPSDSDSSSSSSSSSESDDDMAPQTFAPPPSLIPGATPVSLSQATAITSGASS